MLSSRLDENRDIGEKTEFSASDVLLETVQPYEAPVRTGGKEMEQLVDEGILFTGNERDFRQLVGILVDNAVKYTPEGGKIRIALKKKGKKCQLEILMMRRNFPWENWMFCLRGFTDWTVPEIPLQEVQESGFL